jgi:hypothetical protein
MGDTQAKRPPVQNMGGSVRCVFRYESRMRLIRIWVFKGRVGWWKGNSVLVARWKDRLVVLSW